MQPLVVSGICMLVGVEANVVLPVDIGKRTDGSVCFHLVVSCVFFLLTARGVRLFRCEKC